MKGTRQVLLMEVQSDVFGRQSDVVDVGAIVVEVQSEGPLTRSICSTV